MHLLENARDRTHDRRADDRQVLDDLVDPAVDNGGESDGQRQRKHHLAERMGQWQPQVVQILFRQHAEGIHCRRGVSPRILSEPHPLGFTGGARGVDECGQLVGANRVDAIGYRGRRISEQLCTEPLQFVEGDHPVSVAGAVDDNDLVHGGKIGPVGDEFVDLDLILGHDDPAAGVRDDKGHVLGMSGRVDGGGGCAGGEDGEVDDDPLVPGARGERDPFLGLDPQRDQSRGDERHPVTDLLPGDAGPATVGRITKRLEAGRGRYTIKKHPGNRRRASLDFRHVEPFLGFLQACHGASLGNAKPNGT